MNGMVIRIKDLSYSYDSKRNAVDKLSLEIKKGSYTTIIGHNGSGKSTLAKLLAGLLESKTGEIYIDEIRLCEENLKKIREKLVIVFQNPDNQFIGSTVRDDIAFGLENHQIPTKEMEPIIQEFASKTKVDKFLDKEPSNLSGGQKQRVAIAGALAMKPEIIIFDEATSMLDPKGRKDIKALMKELHKDKELTIISITHDIEEVLQSDDCVVLNKGELYMHDKPEVIFKKPEELRKISLEVPFVSLVKEELNKNGIKVKENDLKGVVEELCQYYSNH